MITTHADIATYLNLVSQTAAQRSLLTVIHHGAEAAVKKHLGYDPEFRLRTEYYPRMDTGPMGVNQIWDSDGTTAYLTDNRMGSDQLQLMHLPIRLITELKVDANGRFGAKTGAFSADALVEGTSFYPQYESPFVCQSGLITRVGSWPVAPGSIRIKYYAGYTTDELAGPDGCPVGSEPQSVSGVELTFAEGSDGDTISRDSGNWRDDGYRIGSVIQITGSDDNDGRYVVESVSDETLTLTAAFDLTAEITEDAVVTAGTVVDASAIKQATLLTIAKAFHTATAMGKKTGSGLAPGIPTSENLGDYSYSIDSTTAARITGMLSSVPEEAAFLLADFVHLGKGMV